MARSEYSNGLRGPGFESLSAHVLFLPYDMYYMSLVMRKPVFYAKTKAQISFAETAKLISAFVFAKRIVQSLYFLNPKFQVSSHLLWLYSPVCVGPGRKPRRPVFSQRGSYVCFQMTALLSGRSILVLSGFIVGSWFGYFFCSFLEIKPDTSESSEGKVIMYNIVYDNKR